MCIKFLPQNIQECMTVHASIRGKYRKGSLRNKRMIMRRLLRTQSWSFEFHKTRSDQPRDYHLHTEPPTHGTNYVFIMVKFWVSRSLEQNTNWTTTSQNWPLPSTGRIQSVSLGNKTSESNQTRLCNYAERIKSQEINAGKKESTKYPQEITCTSNFMDKLDVIQFENNDMPIVRHPSGEPRSNCKLQIWHRYREPLITKIRSVRPLFIVRYFATVSVVIETKCMRHPSLTTPVNTYSRSGFKPSAKFWNC